jgi:hypothetical protein
MSNAGRFYRAYPGVIRERAERRERQTRRDAFTAFLDMLAGLPDYLRRGGLSREAAAWESWLREWRS